MPCYLKQSTAVDIALGPFLDETDGKTAETALTISQADVRLKKNNGNWAQVNESTSASHEENGWYEKALDTTDTNTLGILVVAVHESGALPVWREFMVIPANIYDSLISGSDKIDVNVEEWNTTSVPAEHTAGYPVVTVKDGTGTGELDTASGVVLAKDHTGANLATASALDAVDNFLDTEIAEIIQDTGTDIPATLAAIHAKTTNLPADPADASDIAALIDALPTGNESADALLDRANGIETGYTPRQALRIILSALAGKLAGAATTSVTIRDVGDAKNRIAATVDADGNRTSVTLDAT